MVEKFKKSDIKKVKVNYLTRISAPEVNHKAIKDIILNLKLEHAKIKTINGIDKDKFFKSKITPCLESSIAEKEKEEFRKFAIKKRSLRNEKKGRKIKKKFQKNPIEKRKINLFLETNVPRISDYSGVITEEN